MGYRRIVVGTDGSETAQRAVRAAGEMAAATGARLVVVTAFAKDSAAEQELAASVPDDLRWAISDRNQAEDWARRGRTAARDVGAEDVVIVAEEGSAADVLLTAAEDHAADLIVVGSRGMTETATRVLLGSVANTVSHHAPCDVLVVHTTG